MARNGALEHVKQYDWRQPSGRLKLESDDLLLEGMHYRMRLHGATNCGRAHASDNL